MFYVEQVLLVCDGGFYQSGLLVEESSHGLRELTCKHYRTERILVYGSLSHLLNSSRDCFSGLSAT
jgi:hypothetical protein